MIMRKKPGMEGPSEIQTTNISQLMTEKRKSQGQRPRIEYDKMNKEQQAEAERLWSSYLVVEDAQEPMVTTCDSKGKPTG